MVDCTKSLGKINKDNRYNFAIINILDNIACKLKYCMLNKVKYMLKLYKLGCQMLHKKTHKNFQEIKNIRSKENSSFKKTSLSQKKRNYVKQIPKNT